MIKFTEENKSYNSLAIIETYFFYENEDLTNFFYSEIKSVNNFIIAEITKNQYSNKIGFYQFLGDKNKYIKIYILPKTVSVSTYSNKEDLTALFNNYFKEYLRLKKKYHNYKGYKEVKDNILDVDLINASNIEEYLVKKYRRSLVEIINFFKKHNKEIIIRNDFYSQDISSAIDIKKNIIEINKSKIHQNENIVINYSKIAEITLGSIKLFSNFKVPFFDNSKIGYEVKTLNSILKKAIKNRYIYNQNNTSRAKIYKSLNSKIFNKSSKLVYLKNNLLFLLGWESDNSKIKINDIDSLWFSTDYMYELCVLEYLENLKAAVPINLLPKSGKDYNIMIDGEIHGNIKSIPDFIVETEDTIYIIDAKWKIIYNINSVSFMDILKANRDLIVHNKNSKKIKIIIFYPLIHLEKIIYSGKEITYDYDQSPIFRMKELQLFDGSNISIDNYEWM
ncbi:hypothetical protein [Flavobacterium johnsoniae]|uniref:Uncharacterized protein n=1 Tax=Flavobacterium johnsoniae TaxID=986 RepID=A0A1J7CFN4_FLAJO|nr:hypothetical protein [Flavobacterium johnsoniae]OIV40356.1 hypothetical protein BKM63_20685 [Flavobacterium johnsoniae]